MPRPAPEPRPDEPPAAHRDAPRTARRRARLAAAVGLALAATPAPAAADELRLAWRLLSDGHDGGTNATGAAAGAGAPSLLADAGPLRPVTLPELLRLAVLQAPPLSRATIDLEATRAAVARLDGLDDWTVAAQADAATSLSTFLAGGTSVSSTRTSASLGADLTRQLPTGGSLTLHAAAGYTRSEGDLATAQEFTDELSATLTHALLEGRGRRFARAERVVAERLVGAAELARRQAAIEVVQAVVVAYWDLVAAHRDLEIRRASLRLAEERLRTTKAAIKGGGLARTELLAVEQAIATRQEDILAAELTVLERSLGVRRLAGLAVGPGELGLAVPTELATSTRTWDLGTLIAEAYRASPLLAELAARADVAALEVEVTRNGLLPSLDLSVTLGSLGIDDSPGAALAGVLTVDGFVAGVSLRGEQAVGNRAAAGAVRARRAELERVRLDAADVRAQLAQGLAEAVVLARAATLRAEIAGRTISLAEQNLAAEQARFTLGKATGFDVLERQEELAQAQLRQARARIEWHKAASQVAAVSGSLLADYGIDLPE